jgi:murein DD-endopeptidase MepM/ murein hydrolase activator NlpD
MIGNIDKQIITQKYHWRHRGVDLRSWDFEKNSLLPVITPEPVKVLRMGTDRFGNDFIVCKGKMTNVVLKFIHITIKSGININTELGKYEILGYTQIKGNSRAHHLHFETWKDGKHFDPIIYFGIIGLAWDVRKYRRTNS